jgi:hypothetical protein
LPLVVESISLVSLFPLAILSVV